MAKKPAPPLSQAGGGWRGKAPPPPPRSGLNPSGPPPHHHHRKPHHHGGGAGGAPPLSQAGGGWRGKAPAHKKAKKHPKRKLAGAPLGGGWILGGNDTADNCAAVAVANALLAATGLRVPDAELLRIHDRAGPLSIAEALAAAREIHEADAIHERRLSGLGVQHHAELDALHIGQPDFLDDVAVALLDDHPPAVPVRADGYAGAIGRGDPALVLVHPLIVGLATPHGPHAGLLLGDALVTWGGLMALPDDWVLEECWAVTW
jgi:hypothetical protein